MRVAYRVLSKKFVSRLTVASLLAASGAGATGIINTPLVAQAAQTQVDANVQSLVKDLSTLRTELVVTGGAQAVQEAHVRAQSVDWNKVIFGTDQPTQPNAALTVKMVRDFVNLVYQSNTTTTASDIQAFISDLKQVNPSVTSKDVYHLYQSVKGNFLTGLLTDNTDSMTTITQRSIEEAVIANPVFVDVFSKLGLSPQQLQTLKTSVVQAVDPDLHASRAVFAAFAAYAGSFAATPGPSAVPTGASVQYALIIKGTAGVPGLEGKKLTNFDWSSSNTSVASINSHGVLKALKPGTVTITAKAHGYIVTRFSVTVKNTDKNHRNISVNGLYKMTVPAIVHNNTTYVPIWYVSQALESLGFTYKWDGSHWSLKTPSSIHPNLYHVNPGRGSMEISLNGTAVYRVNGIVALDSGHKTTFMPIWYVMQVLDRCGFSNSWDGTNWNISGPHAIPQPPKMNWPTLQLGSRGSAVVQLQKDLHIQADGVFGPGTLSAVKHFQATHGLVADGVVGPATWAALEK
ncbi:peptidoglycan-binding protein [Alicyclobacillus pomorum]|uniref:peptidoglycan-binding protein n=1 Tax=Alicyclobacillus pomorum TaxID=204470 RepID=UPI00041C9388|nr:peptidoglycan-binding protein [Alicyclobacillus pomorum]